MPATEASDAAVSNASEVAVQKIAKLQYATKTALSLTLAYMIPMALGWPQPQTAATTVMLIAATGAVSESLQKGVLRIIGTVTGAAIGLYLVALFPQDRMVYLLCLSAVVAFIFYLYNAYQGDSTVFMLTAVVTLMMFNGGDADGAFLFGVDRAFMTAFGVIVYTVVGTMLWPVKSEENTEQLAHASLGKLHQAFSALAQSDHGDEETDLSELLAAEEAFQSQLATVKTDANDISAYLGEWNAIASCHQRLQGILIPALKRPGEDKIPFDRYIANYDELIARIDAQFRDIEASWRQQPAAPQAAPLAAEFEQSLLAEQDHLTMAAVTTRADLLDRLLGVLAELQLAMNSLLFDASGFRPGAEPVGIPAFVWFDRENLKTSIRALSTFWIATAIWIQFNPPGGFNFVIFSTILVVLVSYTPVTPRLLIILFTLSFVFSLSAYIFLLPHMTHWVELGLFLFTYAFLGFFVLKGPLTIFFLLGLFTLGIQNQMYYSLQLILLIMLMFYMVCAMQIITIYFPFTSKPERLYRSFRQRFFNACGASLKLQNTASLPRRMALQLRANGRPVLQNKMQAWGAKLDPAYFPDNAQEKVSTLNEACDLLNAQLQVLSSREKEFAANPLVMAARNEYQENSLARLCTILADNNSESSQSAFDEVEARVSDIDVALDKFLGLHTRDTTSRQHVVQFYVFLNLQASILSSLDACRRAQLSMDWEQLGNTRF